jgi:hypothetical protein
MHKHSSKNTYKSGDTVGILLDLRPSERRVHFFKNGLPTEESCEIEEPEGTPFAFCFCIGDGHASIVRTYLPDKMPENFKIE